MLEDKYVVWIMALEARASDESELMLGQICRIGTGYNVVTGNWYVYYAPHHSLCRMLILSIEGTSFVITKKVCRPT